MKSLRRGLHDAGRPRPPAHAATTRTTGGAAVEVRRGRPRRHRRRAAQARRAAPGDQLRRHPVRRRDRLPARHDGPELLRQLARARSRRHRPQRAGHRPAQERAIRAGAALHPARRGRRQRDARLRRRRRRRQHLDRRGTRRRREGARLQHRAAAAQPHDDARPRGAIPHRARSRVRGQGRPAHPDHHAKPSRPTRGATPAAQSGRSARSTAGSSSPRPRPTTR